MGRFASRFGRVEPRRNAAAFVSTLLAERDDLREYVVGSLGTDGSTLVLDETGDLKKGTTTVATQRQYMGKAGRIENAQVAVYAVWATPRGHGFVDRELYVPQSWTDDPERCATAGLPAGASALAWKISAWATCWRRPARRPSPSARPGSAPRSWYAR